MSQKIDIAIQCLNPVGWISEASEWQLSLQKSKLSEKDAFMLGGNGRVSSRMGMQLAYAIIDRFMGPKYDSYGVRQNNHFRKTGVGVSVELPHDCITEQ